MAEILTPCTYADIAGPLIFLAGPIQGALDWHAEAIARLRAGGATAVASPKAIEKHDYYNEQVAWEHHHLERAGRHGVILFWLAREAQHVCDRAYAQTTRFELGEAVTLHRWQGIKVVVGIEDGFSNARYLRLTIAKKAPGIPLCTTLPQTCEVAMLLAGGEAKEAADGSSSRHRSG